MSGCEGAGADDRFRQHLHQGQPVRSRKRARARNCLRALHRRYRCDRRAPCRAVEARPGNLARSDEDPRARLQQRGRRLAHGGGGAGSLAQPRGGAARGAGRRRQDRRRLRTQAFGFRAVGPCGLPSRSHSARRRHRRRRRGDHPAQCARAGAARPGQPHHRRRQSVRRRRLRRRSCARPEEMRRSPPTSCPISTGSRSTKSITSFASCSSSTSPRPKASNGSRAN